MTDGWPRPRDVYWFWRDRKGLVGNLISPLTNVLFLFGLLTLAAMLPPGVPWVLDFADAGATARWLFFCTLALSLHSSDDPCRLCRAHLRAALRLRGPGAGGLGNWLNCLATLQALGATLPAKARRRPLVWVKTEHMYPSRTALIGAQAATGRDPGGARRCGRVFAGDGADA